MFLSRLEIEFVEERNETDEIILENELIFESLTNKTYIVPIGFKSNGLNIPKAFWHILGHPFQKFSRKSAVLHDYLYSIKEDKYIADRIFLEALKVEGCSSIKRFLFYSAVRLFGKKYYEASDER